MTEEEITQLAFKISKNDLKLKLNDIYLDVLGEAFDALDDDEEFNKFKKEIKAKIIILSYLNIDKAEFFTEAIHVFNDGVEKLHKALVDIYPTGEHYCNFSYPNESDDMGFEDNNEFSLDLSDENLLYISPTDIAEDKKMYIDPKDIAEDKKMYIDPMDITEDKKMYVSPTEKLN